LDTAFSNGATRYVVGGVSPNAYSMFGGTNLPGVYQSVGFANSTDGLFTTGGAIEKTNAWGMRGAFNHNWSPNWVTSVYGSYSTVRYTATGQALFCAGMGAVILGQGVTYTCNPNFNIAQIGTVTIWTPVRNLSFSAEVLWVGLDQKMAGVTGNAVSPSATKPTAFYEFKNQNTVLLGLRARRTF
jgi:hypothetical protein